MEISCYFGSCRCDGWNGLKLTSNISLYILPHLSPWEGSVSLGPAAHSD